MKSYPHIILLSAFLISAVALSCPAQGDSSLVGPQDTTRVKAVHVTGVVLYPNGRVASGIVVSVAAGAQGGIDVQKDTTDEQGNYSVLARAMRPVLKASYPGFKTVEQALPMAAGNQQQNLQLQPEAGMRFIGNQLLGPDGKHLGKVEGIRVEDLTSGAKQPATTTDTEGYLHLIVPSQNTLQLKVSSRYGKLRYHATPDGQLKRV